MFKINQNKLLTITIIVSTVVSGILFARFPTVKCISKGCSFHIHWQQHNMSRSCDLCIKSGRKSQFSLSFCASSGNDVRRKLYTVGIHSTVEKRSKGMPDTTVETTQTTTLGSKKELD